MVVDPEDGGGAMIVDCGSTPAVSSALTPLSPDSESTSWDSGPSWDNAYSSWRQYAWSQAGIQWPLTTKGRSWRPIKQMRGRDGGSFWLVGIIHCIGGTMAPGRSVGEARRKKWTWQQNTASVLWRKRQWHHLLGGKGQSNCQNRWAVLSGWLASHFTGETMAIMLRGWDYRWFWRRWTWWYFRDVSIPM